MSNIKAYFIGGPEDLSCRVIPDMASYDIAAMPPATASFLASTPPDHKPPAVWADRHTYYRITGSSRRGFAVFIHESLYR